MLFFFAESSPENFAGPIFMGWPIVRAALQSHTLRGA